MLRSQGKSKKTKVKRSCRERLGSLFLAAATILASWCAGRVGNAAEPFMLPLSIRKAEAERV